MLKRLGYPSLLVQLVTHKQKDLNIKTIGISNAIEEGIDISLIKINEEALAREARAAERLIDFCLEMT